MQRLAQDAANAAEVRAYQTHPDVVALRVEQVRRQVDRLCWAGIALGLAFTMTNVQQFAAAGARPWSLPWLAAWLLDPMVSLVLLAILRAEQVTARYEVHTGRWVRRAKWFTLTATYVMSTWASYAAASLLGVVLHSVRPLVVFAAAEAVTDVRDKLTEAVAVAFTQAVHRPSAVNVDVNSQQLPTRQPVRRRAHRQRREGFTDYLTETRAAWTPSVEITPAWVRQATDCSRGLSHGCVLSPAQRRRGVGGSGSRTRSPESSRHRTQLAIAPTPDPAGASEAQALSGAQTSGSCSVATRVETNGQGQRDHQHQLRRHHHPQ